MSERFVLNKQLFLMVGRVSMRKLSLPDRAFGDLLEYISDENITDINWSRGLWINHLEKGRYKVENFVLKDVLSSSFIRATVI